jgi:hypothetical protein
VNNPLSFDDFVNALLSQLTEDERRGGVAYAAERQLQANTPIQFPGIRIDVPTNSYLGFIDREPVANWGHSAKYVIVNQESGEIQSMEARLPPFRSGDNLHWRVVYKAPSIPENLVAQTE